MPQTFTQELDTPVFKGRLSINTGLYINGKYVDGVDKETTGLLGSSWGEWLEFDGRSVRNKISRPMSLGANVKDNRDRSFGDKLASIAKRRSYSAGISSADKENRRESKIVELVVKEAQKKGPKRGLPFLSRWRG